MGGVVFSDLLFGERGGYIQVVILLYGCDFFMECSDESITLFLFKSLKLSVVNCVVSHIWEPMYINQRYNGFSLFSSL